LVAFDIALPTKTFTYLYIRSNRSREWSLCCIHNSSFYKSYKEITLVVDNLEIIANIFLVQDYSDCARKEDKVMSIIHDELFIEIQQAVAEDRLQLPSLPEVALKIRDLVEDENTTTKQIADILSQDAALSVRLLKVVNSPLYRGETPIDDIHMAVTRMGGQLVRDLIINLAIKQMFQPTSKTVDELFRSAWSTSVNMAASCQMIAASVCGIRKEQALLAGLIHNIGALPLFMIVGSDDDLFNDLTRLSSVVQSLQSRVGALMLESWNFSDDLIEVVTECHNFNYVQKDGSGLVSLVQIALLEGGHVAEEQTPEDWSLVPAFSKLGMDTEVNVVQLEENQKMLDIARQSLMI